MQVLVQDKGMVVPVEVGAAVSQSNLRRVSNVTAGAVTLTPSELLADAVVRTGPIAAYIDTFPTGAVMELDATFAAMPVGSNRKIYFSNQVAFVRTQAPAVGFTLSGNMTNGTAQPANSVCECLLSKIAVGSYNLEVLG